MSKGAVVLLSGGLDSTVCLFQAEHCEEFDHITALSLDYGQRHQAELIAAKQMADAADVKDHVVAGLGTFPVWSALTHGGSLDAKTGRNPKLPASFVPGRNLMFVTLGAMCAYQECVDTVIIGANQVDFSGYPDCREDALAAFELAIQEGFEWPEFELRAPLMDLSKAKIWALAESLGILELVRSSTVSCYNAGAIVHPWGRGCGDCPSCVLRAAGWYEFQSKRSDSPREP